MSLYDGLPKGDTADPSTGGKDKPASWSSAGLRLLQSQIALKKAQATTAMRDRDRHTRNTTHNTSASVAPVFDLSSKNRNKTSSNNNGDLPPRGTPTQSSSMLKIRKTLPLDGPQLSFIANIAKDEPVVIFGEFTVEDEYNPLHANDYVQCAAIRDKDQLQKKEENRLAREAIEAARRQAAKVKGQLNSQAAIGGGAASVMASSAGAASLAAIAHGQLDALDEEREIRKRQMGAAIAPPQALVEQDSRPLEHVMPPPAFTPNLAHNNQKGLSAAARMMQKMGYEKGRGLGKSGQGISTALQVERTGATSGKIVNHDEKHGDLLSNTKLVDDYEDMMDSTPSTNNNNINDPSNMMPPPPLPNNNNGPNSASSSAAAEAEEPSITDLLKAPTKVVLLRNMVGRGEVDDELEPEVKEEMHKFGDVAKVVIFEMPPNLAPSDQESIRIFVEFHRIDHAIKAVVGLNGRFFGGRKVRGSFYTPAKFAAFQLADEN